jgi:hypothetical protein
VGNPYIANGCQGNSSSPHILFVGVATLVRRSLINSITYTFNYFQTLMNASSLKCIPARVTVSAGTDLEATTVHASVE